MKIISWNVNGIRACVNKGLINTMKDLDADVYMFQEVRAEKSKLPIVPNYKEFHTFSEKKGYSGVSTYTRLEPINVIEGIGREEFDREGRVLTLEYKEFFLVNVYFPNSGEGLKRLDYKIDFNNYFLNFCKKLEETKPVIVGSDFNVAHKEIDLARPKQNEKNAGFTIEERNWFTKFMNSGFVDSFRVFEPGPEHYTWWTYRGGARDRNVGWRIDYFVVSKDYIRSVRKSEILSKVRGSDHCPILIEIQD